MTYETLTYETDGHVTVLTLNRPEQRNAVNRQMNSELHDAWQRFRDAEDEFVMVMTGTGSAFCAGWDLADAAATEMGDWNEFRTYLYNSPGECGYTRKADVFKPVIAAVNGWAVAAGLETALLADIRIAAENAVFGALERRWNIVAGDGMTVRLPLVVGWGRAMELMITGRPVGAEEALRIGLANEMVPEGKSLERSLELAHEIAGLPQGAIRTDKETLIRNIGRTFEEQLRQEADATLAMFMRRDSHAIGAGAFKEGRTPEWPHHGFNRGMGQHLSVEVDGGIAIVRIDRPPANAMNLELLEEGMAVAEELRADLPAAVVLTGREGYFSAGVDLKFAPTLDEAGQREMVNGINRLFLGWYSLPRPVVCAVNGHAIAGGFILALCGDYRIGATEGKYGLTELRVGAPYPSVAMAAVQAELSALAARELVLRAHLIDGEEAMRLGAFDELREPAEVLPRALQVAAELAEMLHTYERVKMQLRGATIERMEALAAKEERQAEAWLGPETGQAAASVLRDRGTD